MLGKLRFKTSMFEGVLDDGEDSVFITDDKFSKMMETVSGIVEEEEDTPTDTDTNAESSVSTISIDEEEKPKTHSNNDESNEAKDEETTSPEDVSMSVADTVIPQPSVGTKVLEQTEANVSEEEEEKFHTSNTSYQAQSTSTSHHPSRPKDLVAQGISFLSGLAETLKSPEATAQLVDSIIEKDEQTGETSIKIPVDSKETVSNLLSIIGKLFAK